VCARTHGVPTAGRTYALTTHRNLAAQKAWEWQNDGIVLPMKTTIDRAGRIVLPKPLRDALGLEAGSTVDVSQYGSGLQIVAAGRTARLVEEDGVLVATGDTAIDDETLINLIDTARR
jgi:AbrB family looped-hinge helix DNA binding protein